MSRWTDLVRRIDGSKGVARRVGFGVLLFAALGLPAAAQSSGVTPEQLLQLQQMRSGSSTTTAPSVSPRETILEPTSPSQPLPTSDLEQILSMRAGVRLQQYGYDQLGIGRAVSLPQAGGVQSNYILGVGDEVVLTLRGQENNEYRTQVDRDGNVTFPKLNPVSAAGRNFDQFRQDLINSVRRAFTSTDGFVTIGRVRQISVMVSGEVGSPGVRTLTGLSTVMDAILVSGGIKKSGSLRNVQILRGGKVISVDLYSALVGGVHSKNVTLADGDKVLVPTIGGVFAVAGQARRPGIYELPAGQRSVRIATAVALAGGKTVAGSYTVSLLRTLPDGRRQLVDVTNAGGVLNDGEIILIKSSVNISVNQVTLAGAVRAPGTVASSKYKTLHDLLPSTDVLAPGAYMLFGVIDRTDPATLQHTILPFSPLAAIQGKINMPLISDDVVRVFTKPEMRRMAEAANDPNPDAHKDFAAGVGSGGVPLPGYGPQIGNGQQGGVATQGPLSGNGLPPMAVPGSGLSAGAAMAAGSAPLASGGLANMPGAALNAQQASALNAQQASAGMADPMMAYRGPANGAGAAGAPIAGAMAPSVSVDPNLSVLTTDERMAVLKTASDYVVVITGAVRDPGVYLAYPGSSVSDLVSAADGLAEDVDLREFEMTTTKIDNQSGASLTTRALHPASNEYLKEAKLHPFDRLVFHRVFSDKAGGSVRVEGEVQYPGDFDILRNERLSSVLRRAGGFTDIAYPLGTVFRRVSIAKAEQEESSRIVSDLRSQLLSLAVKPTGGANSQPISAESMVAIQSLISQVAVTPALGRMPVIADVKVLEKNPDLDILLEPGDTITIPKRPSSVLVMGDVLRSGAQRYVPSRGVTSYIESAGGTTDTADTSRIVVVLPDGSVRADNDSWLNFWGDSDIPPGSTIYVPRKLDVFEFRELLTDTIQIFSQLATSAAALAVLSKN